MIVRSALPWPIRWAVYALVFGFSASIALWAFEFGKDIAGLDRSAKEELIRVRSELAEVRLQRDKAQAIADTADSLLKAERAAQERLAQQVKQAEAENLALKGDLGFFERLMPAAAGAGFALRGLQAEVQAPGRVSYQLLVARGGKGALEFKGKYEVQLAGTLDGQPWSLTPPTGIHPLTVRQYARLEGSVEYPAQAMVKTLQVKVLDGEGSVRATQTFKLQ